MQEAQLKPDIIEQYSVATNASNLRVEMDSARRSQADVLMAAGWGHSTMGGALGRLRSEWDSVPRPPKPDIQTIAAIAGKLPKVRHELAFVSRKLTHIETADIKAHDRADLSRRMAAAAKTAEEWHVHEIRLMLGRLKTLPAIRGILIDLAIRIKAPNPQEVVAEVLTWWLDPVCPVCHGEERDRTTHGKAMCPVCKGKGERKLPQGEIGKRLSNLIDDSVEAWKNSMRKRFKHAKNGA